MAVWTNHASGVAARNGTKAHVIGGSSPSTGGSWGFTATAGRLLVAILAAPNSIGALGNAGWTEQAQPGASVSWELSVWTKVATGNDSLPVQHTSEDVPMAWDVYEFSAGSTFVGVIGESANDNTFPPLSGLSGSNFILASYHVRPFSTDVGTPTASVTAGWTESADIFEPAAASGTPKGIFMYNFYREGYQGGSVTPTFNVTLPGPDWTAARQKLVIAINPVTVAPALSPTNSSLQLLGKVPTIRTPKLLRPTRPLFTLTGHAPMARVSNGIPPEPATMLLHGGVPVVREGGPKTAEPDDRLLMMQGHPPNLTVSVIPKKVLVLDPAIFGLAEKKWLNGEVTKGNSVVQVNYPNNPLKPANYAAGAAALDVALHANAGPKVVLGHAMGAQVAYYWLRMYGPTSDIPPSQLEFVVTGNPERKYGGTLRVPRPPLGTQFIAGGGYPGLPENTPYRVLDFSRQYDYYSDYPNVEKPSLTAALNASSSIHNNYYDVKISDPKNTKYVEGNVTYMLSPTNLWWQPEYTRKKIEESYYRPVNAPEPPPITGPPPPEPGDPEAPVDISFPDNITDLSRLVEAIEAYIPKEKPLHEQWHVEVCDYLWRPIAGVGDDLMELVGTDPQNNVPSATLKVKGDSKLIPHLFNCKNTMVGVKIETGGLRFAFYVDTFDYTFENGEWVGTANLLGIWDILNYLQIWPMWYAPIQAQPISHAFYVWSICTAIESMIAEQAFRIQTGMWEFFNNALSLNPDIRAWFGTMLQGNGKLSEMLKTPVYVVRTNPFLDTSPLIARTVRMESCGTVIRDITRAYGVDVSVTLWLPGDPQPDKWADLKVPTYVVTVKDRSQIEGPNKNILDSVIRTSVDAGGAFFGEIDGIIEQVPGMDGVYTSPILGIEYTPPWAILVAPEPGQKGSVMSCKVTAHTPKGWQHIIGGRSPKWLNDLFNATFAWIIDSISIVIGFTGIPSNLLEGFLNNAFLAFQLIQVYSRRDQVGPYHPNIEVFHATSSSPYNVETLFAFINAIWDSRGYISAQATFRNGEVLTLGRDVFKGGLISVLYMGGTRLFTDYITNIMFRLTPTERDVHVQIGDGKAEEAPLAKHQRFLTGVVESINVVTLAPQSG